MPISPENLLYHELVGLDVEISDSPDTSIRGLSGRIVGESKQMLTIRTDMRTVRVAKQVASRMRVVTDLGVCFISGSSLIGKPEDRIGRLN